MPSKKEMQQAYRSKETQGFQDLHCALQTVDPHSPIQRDVARYQLLSMGKRQRPYTRISITDAYVYVRLAAKRLRELAHEKQLLSQELSLRRQSQSPRPPHMYAPNELLCSPDQVFPLWTLCTTMATCLTLRKCELSHSIPTQMYILRTMAHRITQGEGFEEVLSSRKESIAACAISCMYPADEACKKNKTIYTRDSIIFVILNIALLVRVFNRKGGPGGMLTEAVLAVCNRTSAICRLDAARGSPKAV
ncbi:hypothetical protein F5J12DRAFT_298859 [Pisolithus orientalis]|uniref:uncharacterized protein n=1 Tax=Pisolithus orientalis TaxID=936130 RepID=UPI00222433BE|nr:uncharacterized protein F5J12DRAFT_298859 [Pisolithus orientalis]KAI6030580.1 hypothetical protein F5J12DRAFT_298859 [Pisolithus orientalis]